MIYLIHLRPTRKFLLPDPRIIHSSRGYNRHPRHRHIYDPRITTAHSAQISTTASLGCKVREFVCVDCVRRMLFIQDLQPDNLGIYWLYYSHNEVWAILSDGATPGLGGGYSPVRILNSPVLALPPNKVTMCPVFPGTVQYFSSIFSVPLEQPNQRQPNSS